VTLAANPNRGRRRNGEANFQGGIVEYDVWEIVAVSVGVTVGIVVVSALAAAAVSFIDERVLHHRRPQH
jgi:hypothetical protein